MIQCLQMTQCLQVCCTWKGQPTRTVGLGLVLYFDPNDTQNHSQLSVYAGHNFHCVALRKLCFLLYRFPLFTLLYSPFVCRPCSTCPEQKDSAYKMWLTSLYMEKFRNPLMSNLERAAELLAAPEQIFVDLCFNPLCPILIYHDLYHIQYKTTTFNQVQLCLFGSI